MTGLSKDYRPTSGNGLQSVCVSARARHDQDYGAIMFIGLGVAPGFRSTFSYAIGFASLGFGSVDFITSIFWGCHRNSCSAIKFSYLFTLMISEALRCAVFFSIGWLTAYIPTLVITILLYRQHCNKAWLFMVTGFMLGVFFCRCVPLFCISYYRRLMVRVLRLAVANLPYR